MKLYKRQYDELEPLETHLYITSILDTLDSSQVLLLDPTCKPLVNALAHQWGGPFAGIIAWGNKALELITQDPDRIGENLLRVVVILAMKSVITATAEKDAISLVSNYGCQRPVTKQVYTNSIDYLTRIIAPKTEGEQTAELQ